MLDHLEDQQQNDGQAKESGDNEASLSLDCLLLQGINTIL